MKTTVDQPWIEIGYSLFSRDGASGLKVDLIAKKIGISRSSFYHHFADMEIFQEKLLQYHLTRAKRASEKVKLCKTMDPEFLLMMVEEKEYILFNRQLRNSREVPLYKTSFETAIGYMIEPVMPLWSEMLGLKHKPDVALKCFMMTADILFHRMTAENMNFEWLKAFLDEMKIFFREVDGIKL
jgi:AcrR family transcriptional regulator